jgi:hypothetical protein
MEEDRRQARLERMVVLEVEENALYAGRMMEDDMMVSEVFAFVNVEALLEGQMVVESQEGRKAEEIADPRRP